MIFWGHTWDWWMGFGTGMAGGFDIVLLALLCGVKVGFKPHRSSVRSSKGVAR